MSAWWGVIRVRGREHMTQGVIAGAAHVVVRVCFPAARAHILQSTGSIMQGHYTSSPFMEGSMHGREHAVRLLLQL